jgi:AcrR family transcriptional regulator
VGAGADPGHNAPLPTPPTQARGVQTRDRLRTAALAGFARDGIAATRIEDIVEEAGVSWATFFRYFPRKEDVLIAAAANHFREHVKAPALEALGDRRRPVRRMIETTFESLSTPVEMTPELHAAAMLEVTGNPARFAALVDDGSVQPMIELVADQVAEGQRRSEVRGDLPAAAIAITVVAGSYYPGVQAAAQGADPRAAMAIALDLIWGGIAG